MNKRGQALVEFIIILPIIIFIMLAIVDYGSISFNKNKMESITNDIANMYHNNESIDEINKFISNNDKDINFSYEVSDKYINVKLTKKYKYITPGIDNIIKNNEIVVERVIYNEE